MRIILLGFGVVGQSLAKVILKKQRELAETYGLKPRFVAVADSKGCTVDPRGLDLRRLLAIKRRAGTVANSRSSPSVPDALRELDAEVVVEATPTDVTTGEPGLSHIRGAMISKKNVVTTNKGPLSLALPALLELAGYNGVQLRYSGAVGGGTPVLDFGDTCARGDRIVSVQAVLNGTTNFILTQMEERGLEFSKALKLARQLGYAEANPSLDVDGVDTACKLVILANHVLGVRATLPAVKTTGIRGLTLRQVKNAQSRRKAIRLIGVADDGLSVSPRSIDIEDPLCIKGALNAVKFRCQYSGDKVIVGRGAGGVETASAVLRDLLDIREKLSHR